jgi:hypothetical protein
MSDQLDSLLAGIDAERQIAIWKVFNAIPISVTTLPHLHSPSANLRPTAMILPIPWLRSSSRKPAAYSGAIDADACINFINNQKEYFTVIKLSLSKWVQYTALKLIDDAKS